jgi:TolB protein
VEDQPVGALAVATGTLVAVGLLVLMMVLVEAQPAEATFPGQNGRIAYSSLTKTEYEIFTTKPTGGKPFNVTKNTTDDFTPAYSPNGRRIAYEGDRSGIDIYTISATGGSPLTSPKT